MPEIWLRYDMRSPAFGTKPEHLCRIALEQAQWADSLGFDVVHLPEHHGIDDGYNPSTLVFASAFAARTKRMRLYQLLLLPLHDPIRIAEDLAVLDIISGGRTALILGLGYVPSEFAMFGVSLRQRAALMDSKIEALRHALEGEAFTYEGRAIHVTPRPIQRPTPPLYVGGAVAASARRAARLGDGFVPSVMTEELRTIYLEACSQLGKAPGTIIDSVSGPQFIFVSEDPERAWCQIAPHALYEANFYANLAAENDIAVPFTAMEDVAALKASGVYRVVTPAECVDLAAALDERGAAMIFNPLLCGMPEELSWSSLELFASQVLPAIRGNVVPADA
ncbi:hypothetical protein BSL82_04575 [Tardibacter chloracetimidivorans]|uniref:Luciferase-like domain-containing protein n=1 Tax=Tardibacter chloracetimidivorans TaxID=1921510 RepID=A0A1L3ZSR9_9SPHN|nr:LLM class flavin-dependent oxidoreductase [Tardibacter chloracetimidivorans]API58674.1 hypothetical protein BSL82_04575 [Tardibacter chloracetimidivorans]